MRIPSNVTKSYQKSWNTKLPRKVVPCAGVLWARHTLLGSLAKEGAVWRAQITSVLESTRNRFWDYLKRSQKRRHDLRSERKWNFIDYDQLLLNCSMWGIRWEIWSLSMLLCLVRRRPGFEYSPVNLSVKRLSHGAAKASAQDVILSPGLIPST